MATTRGTTVLEVNLSQGKISPRAIDESVRRKYIGGSGLAARILWDETTADTDPLSPENPLIFMVGPLTGIVRSSSRYVVVGLSPLTGIYGQAHSGGDWADELRHAGFQGIVIKGAARQPVYLWLHDGEAEIRDASHLWGKDTYEVEELLRQETASKASVATIGPAGEKLVRIACIMNDGKKGRAAARCGLGALMGAKKLKAIVARGTQAIEIPDEKRFEESCKRIYEASPITRHEEAVTAEVKVLKEFIKVGGAPIKNWQGGNFDAGFALADQLFESKPLHCRHCPYSDMESKLTPEGERHMVWEHWGPLGTNCLISDARALQEAYALCNRYGLDTISTGGVVAFAMECYEKGLITEKDTGGIKLNWGNHEAMVEMVRQIGERKGFGGLLGEGVRRAAEKIGGIASEYAMHVKGLELPAHDPRAQNGRAVQYATGSIGAAHMEAMGASRFESYLYEAPEAEKRTLRVAKEFGYPAKLDRFETKGKGELTAKTQNFGCLVNSLTVCQMLFGTQKVRPSDFVEMLNLVTGWDMKLEDCMMTGERIFNLIRMFNVRRGISRKDDTLPARLLTHQRGEGGAAENLPHLGAMLSEYYSYRGWSEEGIPTREKLTELGLNECL